MAKISLGSLAGSLSGRSDNAVFVRQANGRSYVRGYTTPRNPRTPAQQERRAAFQRATKAFKQLPAEEHRAWVRYAASLARTDPDTGAAVAPRPFNLFTTLATKFLLVHPDGAIPTLPPASGFGGDGITVGAAGAAKSVVFTANFPNTPGVVTELLLQPLAGPNRRPIASRYRTRAFVAFAEGGQTRAVEARPGAHAAAIRFVNGETGQASALFPLGTVVAG